jgi:hypothetical protein
MMTVEISKNTLIYTGKKSRGTFEYLTRDEHTVNTGARINSFDN